MMIAEETAAAVIDTSITSVTEVPIEKDACAEIEDEIKCKLEAIEGLKLEVEALREQLKDLKKKDAAVDEKHMQDVISKFKKVCDNARKKDAIIELKTQGGGYYWIECDWDLLNCYVNDDSEAVILFNGMDVAHYKDSKQFEKVVKDFAAAIERGDEEFIFPADDSAQKK